VYSGPDGKLSAIPPGIPGRSLFERTFLFVTIIARQIPTAAQRWLQRSRNKLRGYGLPAGCFHQNHSGRGSRPSGWISMRKEFPASIVLTSPPSTETWNCSNVVGQQQFLGVPTKSLALACFRAQQTNGRPLAALERY